MGGYISFAKFNRKHLYIVSSILFMNLKEVVLFRYNYNDSFKPLFDDQVFENFSKHYLIKNILCYIIIFILSFILYKIESKNLEMKSLNNLKYYFI
jgi:hypothetical protein